MGNRGNRVHKFRWNTSEWTLDVKENSMRTIGNIIWFLIGGWADGLAWLFAGVVCCITIIGIPFGRQCFKFASITVMPFKKDIEYGGGAVSFIVNIIWLLFIGAEMAIVNVIAAFISCLTIIGIPFAGQFLKIAKLWLMPFGAKVRDMD